MVEFLLLNVGYYLSKTMLSCLLTKSNNSLIFMLEDNFAANLMN